MFPVRDFPAFEDDRRFNLVALLQELAGVTRLELEIVIVGVRVKSQLLQLGDMLVFPLDLVALRLFVLVFSVIHDLTYRRGCIRHNLYQIKPALLRYLHRLTRAHDADLSAVVDHADLGRPDFLVDANFV